MGRGVPGRGCGVSVEIHCPVLALHGHLSPAGSARMSGPLLTGLLRWGVGHSPAAVKGLAHFSSSILARLCFF